MSFGIPYSKLTTSIIQENEEIVCLEVWISDVASEELETLWLRDLWNKIETTQIENC